MKLSIRLQQHGKKNHPFWWIVVAPQKSNTHGRFIEHIGFWSPREGINMKRQIIFNMPRLKYWLANGAIPTFKIHRFMSMWGLMPKPWYYKKSPQQWAKLEKPEEQMTEKQKILAERKRKRKQREELSPHNLYASFSKSMFPNETRQKLLAKRNQQDFQNDILRDMLHRADFQKYEKLAQLSTDKDTGKPYSIRLNEAKENLRKLKSELIFLQKQHSHENKLFKSRLMERINGIYRSIQQMEKDKWTYQLPQNLENEQEYITEDYLKKKLQYELITQKFQKMGEEMQRLEQLKDPITSSEFVAKLKEMRKENNERESIDDAQMYKMFQDALQVLGQNGKTITKFDLAILTGDKQIVDLFIQPQEEQIRLQKFENLGVDEVYRKNDRVYLTTLALHHEVAMPTMNPVHPRPDLHSYIPEEHFEPIDDTSLQIITMDSLDPHEEVQKYHEKRQSA